MVHYDATAGRFVLVHVTRPKAKRDATLVCVAVSKSEDATGLVRTRAQRGGGKGVGKAGRRRRRGVGAEGGQRCGSNEMTNQPLSALTVTAAVLVPSMRDKEIKTCAAKG